jgi:hypothetical protein
MNNYKNSCYDFIDTLIFVISIELSSKINLS